MASILKVDTLTGVTTAGSISVTGEGNSTTTNLQQGLAKAWLNLNGTGTIAIVESLNIASVADNGTGAYTATYTSSMSVAENAITGSAGANSNVMHCTTVLATSSFKTEHRDFANTLTDLKPMTSVNGDLA